MNKQISWANMLSVVDLFKTGKLAENGTTAQKGLKLANCVVKNDSGIVLAPGSALRVTGRLHPGVDFFKAISDFQDRGMEVSGGLPVYSESQTLAFITEGARPDAIVRARIPGAFAAIVASKDEGFSYATGGFYEEGSGSGSGSGAGSGADHPSCLLFSAASGPYRVFAKSAVYPDDTLGSGVSSPFNVILGSNVGDLGDWSLWFCFLVPVGGGGGHYVGRTTGSAVQNATRTATIPVDFNDTSAEIRFPLTRPGAMLQASYTVIVSKNIETGEFEIISVECPVEAEPEPGSGE